jgi:hypothetical protein
MPHLCILPAQRQLFLMIGAVIATLTSCSRQPKYIPERDLIVFVGKELSLEEQKPEKDPSDAKFKARYQVLKVVFGSYNKEEISFTVYDHYGRPEFAKYETALLFVSSYEGELYHEKYQFFDVYPTKNSRWATCGDPYKFDDAHRGSLKPEKIDFVGNVKGASGPCTEGNYIEDLFKVKKEGVLKTRGLFK